MKNLSEAEVRRLRDLAEVGQQHGEWFSRQALAHLAFVEDDQLYIAALSPDVVFALCDSWLFFHESRPLPRP